MSRWGRDIDHDDERHPEQGSPITVPRSGGDAPFERERDRPTANSLSNSPQQISMQRERVVYRDRDYQLRASELSVMFEVGRFRVVPLEDLRREIYAGRKDTLLQDAHSLERQGLAKRLSAPDHDGRKGLALLVLTPAGRGLLEKELRHRCGNSRDTPVYAGGVHPRELLHDAMLYRMYHKEARRIEQAGGAVRAVQLDAELKSKAWSALARLRREHHRLE